MTNIAVIYYSSTGNVHRLAVAAAEAAEKEGAQVRLLRIPRPDGESIFKGTEEASAAHVEATRDIPEVRLADLEWADGIMLGTPVRFGLPASAVMRFMDTTAELSIPGNLADKAVTAFASGSGPRGGHETTLLALHNSFCHWGSVIVPTGSTDPVLFKPNNGNPYGTSTVTRNVPGNVHEENIEAAEAQARRLLKVAGALSAGLRAL